MARKGNLKKKGASALNDDKSRGVVEAKTANVETHVNSNSSSTPCKDKLDGVDDGRKRKQSGGRSAKKENKQGKDVKKDLEDSFTYKNDVRDEMECSPSVEATGISEAEETAATSFHGLVSERSSLGYRPEGLGIEHKMDSIGFSWKEIARQLRESSLQILIGTGAWIERQKPLLNLMRTKMFSYCDLVRTKIELAYPVVLRWFMHLGNIVLVLSMVWLDCALRGIDSLLRMGTTSFFTILWCTVLSAIAMIGFVKFFIIMVVAVLLGVYAGLTLAVLLVAICGMVSLWLCGSFWTTSLFILLGGLSFAFKRERLALFVVTLYSTYCAWTYVGWTGLVLGLNLSFISSDALLYFLRNNINDQRGPNRASEQTAGMQGPHGFASGDPLNSPASESGFRHSADRGPGVPSTSGTDVELSSEEEVIRLLNCSNHYSALGLSKYENVDVCVLKREYRKKAMLVHPDKNMGNEKAVEAFKKLQNAYEVLFDSLKRKSYDDELRREELLNYFQRIQHESQKNGFFPSGFSRTGNESDDLFAEARRIACKKCGDFHIWFHTQKIKSQARWCQDCKEFHPAKDGDGWVEQSSQPFLFGILQKVDAPVAFVCADSRIYNATEWYICQGMRCLANTHKPSFHVNTSITLKHGSKGSSSSGHRGGGGGIPSSNVEESMAEEEFFEWLQNAVQAGAFDNFGGSTSAESPPAKNGSGFKANGNSNTSSKRKKKGKKQW